MPWALFCASFFRDHPSSGPGTHPGVRESGIRGTRVTGNRIYGTEGRIVFDGGNLLVYTEHAVDDIEAGEWTTFFLPDDLA